MKRLFLGAFLCLLTVMLGQAQVYLAGALNGWSAANPMAFSRNSDGLYFLKANFAGNQEFKLSTVRPTDAANAWTQFDSGVIGLGETAVADKWLSTNSNASVNITAPEGREYTVFVDLTNHRIAFSTTGAAPGSTPGPTPEGAWSGTLPVLFINTTDNLPVDSKEVYRKGTYYLDPMGVAGVEAIGSKDEPLGLQVKGRGNYTWTGFDKKPYRLKLDAKAPLMGMKSSKQFAILAHADDNLGYMRNEMGFALSRKLGMPWTPATAPIEVVLNGDYIGLYWLTEIIRVDKDRVNVIEQEDNATTDVDGGWLVEIDNYDTDPHVTVKNADNYDIWFTYKSPEILSTEQETYLQSQMEAINQAVDGNNFDKLAELVDIDILARYYIVQQLMQDRESFHGSCYLNRQRGAEEKWKFGPVWDFGNAFSDTTGDNPGFIDSQTFYQVWIPKIYRMPKFVEAVKKVWSTVYANACDDVITNLKTVAESIVAASNANNARWPQYAQTDIMGKYDTISKYLRNSRGWCMTQWGQGIASDDPIEPVTGGLYLAGTVNNWSASNPMTFEVNADGLYYLSIDFSAGTAFKISTVKPTSTENTAAWAEFDNGVLGLQGTAKVNEWQTLTPKYVPNINAPSASRYTVYVDLFSKKIMFSDGSFVPTPQRPWSGTLPVLFVNTVDNQPVDSKEVYRKGTYYLDPMGVEGVEPIGTKAEPLGLQIKGRGNYTWIGFDKKPYRLKLDAKAPLMGMKSSKQFAILAHADDDLGYMRNVTGFALSRKLQMPWTPATAPIEVVLNGDYIGLYWLTEIIRVDKDRVNVVEQEDNATTDVDGGWLVEIDNYDTDPHVTVNTTGSYPVWFTYKSPEVLSQEQENYLLSQMQAINNAVMQGNFEKLTELVDIDILARFYMVQQMMQNHESFHGSCYLNRQRGELNRWKFGPVWDFGNSFMGGYGESPNFIGDSQFYQVWISEIYNMPDFVNTVKGVWQSFGETGCQEVLTEVKPVAESIAVAAKSDAARWPQYGQTDIMDKYNTLKTYLNNSHTWGVQQWGKVSQGSISIETGNQDTVRYFNLQGIELPAPVPGTVLIKVTGSKVEKIIYK